MKDIDFLKKNGIDVDSALTFLGDIDTYNEILEEFLNVSSDRMIRIDNAKNNMDMNNYAIDVHALKSDSKYLGFTNLAEMALEHQLKAQENDINFINGHYTELIDEVNKIIKIAGDYFN